LYIVLLGRRIFRYLMIDGGCQSIMIVIPDGMSALGQGNPHRYLGSRGMLIGRCGTLGHILLV
jgi:hypothetical protein